MDTAEDLDPNIIAQHSPHDDQESENEGVEVLPQVRCPPLVTKHQNW
jgi:hypothetical protein